MEAILPSRPVLDGQQSIMYASLYITIRHPSSISLISSPKKSEKKFKFVQGYSSNQQIPLKLVF